MIHVLFRYHIASVELFQRSFKDWSICFSHLNYGYYTHLSCVSKLLCWNNGQTFTQHLRNTFATLFTGFIKWSWVKTIARREIIPSHWELRVFKVLFITVYIKYVTSACFICYVFQIRNWFCSEVFFVHLCANYFSILAPWARIRYPASIINTQNKLYFKMFSKQLKQHFLCCCYDQEDSALNTTGVSNLNSPVVVKPPTLILESIEEDSNLKFEITPLGLKESSRSDA